MAKHVMDASNSTSEAAGRQLKHLGFIENSVQRVVDGSCEALDAGFDGALVCSGDTCRPRVENAKEKSSDFAKRAAHTAKQGTASVLKKLDPTVDRAIASARATTVGAQDVMNRVDQAADRAASHPRVQQSYRYAKETYTCLHDTTVATPTYKKVYSTTAASMMSLTTKVRSSRLYAEHVAQYTEPLVEKVISTTYCKAVVAHLKPAHTTPARDVAHGGTVDCAAAAAATTAPAL